MEEGQLPCGSSHSGSYMPVVSVLCHNLHNFCFQLFLMVLVLSTSLSSLQFLSGLEYVTSFVSLNVGQSKEEPACTGRGRQSCVSSQGSPSRTGLRVLLRLVLGLKSVWVGSYSVSSEHRLKQRSVPWQRCSELEPVTWFLWEKDKLETPNFDPDWFSRQGWLLHGVYSIAVE